MQRLGTYGHLFPHRDADLTEGLGSGALRGRADYVQSAEGHRDHCRVIVTTGLNQRSCRSRAVIAGGRWQDRTADICVVSEVQGCFRRFTTSADSCGFPAHRQYLKGLGLPSFIDVFHRRVSNPCPTPYLTRSPSGIVDPARACRPHLPRWGRLRVRGAPGRRPGRVPITIEPA